MARASQRWQKIQCAQKCVMEHRACFHRKPVIICSVPCRVSLGVRMWLWGGVCLQKGDRHTLPSCVLGTVSVLYDPIQAVKSYAMHRVRLATWFHYHLPLLGMRKQFLSICPSQRAHATALDLWGCHCYTTYPNGLTHQITLYLLCFGLKLSRWEDLNVEISGR